MKTETATCEFDPTPVTVVERAGMIAHRAHAGQFRRDGVTPYIRHPEAVVARLKAQGASDDALAAAWLHDVLEDTKITVVDLMAAGIPTEVTKTVMNLTRFKGEEYEDYLRDYVLGDSDAKQVKVADILCNLADSPTEKQIVKYAKALLILLT